MKEAERDLGKTSTPARRRNHAVWLGPVIVFAGAVSYFLYFARFADLRDFPWINLPIIGLGFLISAVGLARARVGSAKTIGRVSAWLGLIFSIAISGLFCFYIFDLSYQLPKATELSVKLSQSPEVALRDPDGKLVRLSDFRGRKLIITFYRGHW